MPRRTAVLFLCLGLAIVPNTANAQFGKFKEKIKSKVDPRVETKTDEKVDCTREAWIDKDECAQYRKEHPPKEEVAPAAEPASESAAGGNAAALKPGEGAWANFDFVPGERPMFVEDFTKDRVGNFPKRLELVNGNAEVVEWQGRRWLRVNDDTDLYINLPETLPQRWTMEFDMTVPWQRMAVYSAANADDYYESGRIEIYGTEAGYLRPRSGEGSRVDPRNVFSDMFDDVAGESVWLSRPFRFRVQADGKYLKVYMEEKRIANVPNSEFGHTNRMVFHIPGNDVNGKTYAPLITNISINAGGKDMYDALSGDGRLALQGIYFDTGSDRIRPESSGTLAEIADMLKEHADLKILIEGHTDNVGDAAANQTLSEKRAAAVAATLAGKYGIAADRLQSKGFGASKPAAPNDSPENRQKNRRVELVKM